jgi:tetratricopeptide (TPR) repeat protein
MENYYSLLGVNPSASFYEIKRAFREKAKRLHPDVASAAGIDASGAAAQIRLLIAAYEVLSNADRRYSYDCQYTRLDQKKEFDYRSFLVGRADDPASQARLVLFDLFHEREEAALNTWRSQGGLSFSMKPYLDRGDWMDGLYVLAEELHKRECYYEAFILLAELVKEERLLPYFKHFTVDVEVFLKELVRLKLKPSVDQKTWVACMETMLELGFPARDEARWLRSIAETLFALGETAEAQEVFRKALLRDPCLPNTKRLRKKLAV